MVQEMLDKGAEGRVYPNLHYDMVDTVLWYLTLTGLLVLWSGECWGDYNREKVEVIIIGKKTYYTTIDAAKVFGVSAKTLRSYIDRGIIPKPPEVQYGLRTLKHFPRGYMEKAMKLLENYRYKKMP